MLTLKLVIYKGIFHKGKFYEASDAMETAIIIKKNLNGELKNEKH